MPYLRHIHNTYILILSMLIASGLFDRSCPVPKQSYDEIYYMDVDYESQCQQSESHPLSHFNVNGPQNEEIDRCTRLYITDLGSEFTDGEFMKVKEFIYFSTKSCLSDFVGHTIAVTPMFQDELMQTCCDADDCLEMSYKLNETVFVNSYNGTNLVWTNKKFVQRYINVLLRYLKEYMQPPCPKNSAILISNRIIDMTVAENIYDEIYTFFNDALSYYCTTFDIVIVNRVDLTHDYLNKQYGKLSARLFDVPNYDCLSGNFINCMAPCNNVSYDYCVNQNLTQCSERRLPPYTPHNGNNTLTNDYWHITYIFALSRNITEKQFLKIKNSIRIPLDDYYKSGRNLAVGLFFPDYKVAWLFDIKNIEKALNVQHVDNVCKADLIDEESTVTPKLFSDAVTAYKNIYPKFESQPNRNPLPRIVLITDFVSKKFTDSYLDVGATHSVSKFEFRLYAFNLATFEYYDGRHLVPRGEIFPMNASNPLLIAIDGGESEYTEPFKSENTIYYVTIGGFTISILILAACTVLYKQKLVWMKKIENLREIHHVQRDTSVDCWELSWDKLLLKNEKLGSGAYGEVYRGVLRGKSPVLGHAYKAFSNSSLYGMDDKEVAIKALPRYASEAAKKEFMVEIELMKVIGHNESIVNMFGCITTGPKICLVLEYCPYGDLLHYVKEIKKEMKMAENYEEETDFAKEFLLFCWQISDGMRFIAGKGIVHRDLAARNILIDSERNAKIADFGLCVIVTNNTPKRKINNNMEVTSHLKTPKGSLSGRFPIKWLAIECLQRQEFSTKSDVWAFGITIFEIYSLGKIPFEQVLPTELLQHLENGNRPPRPELCPIEVYDIIRKCWLENPEERPSFQELLTLFTVQLERATEGYGYLSLLKTSAENYYINGSKLALAKSFRHENMERKRSRAASCEMRVNRNSANLSVIDSKTKLNKSDLLQVV